VDCDSGLLRERRARKCENQNHTYSRVKAAAAHRPDAAAADYGLSAVGSKWIQTRAWERVDRRFRVSQAKNASGIYLWAYFTEQP
jgi:hypothetical protein